MLRRSFALASLAALAVSASAQTPLWAKARLDNGGLRILNGTKMVVGDYDLNRMRAYDFVNGKFMNGTIFNFMGLSMNREVSVDGSRFLIHGDGVDTFDSVWYLDGNNPVNISIPGEMEDEFGDRMTGSTKLSRDGKWVFQLWANGRSDYYSATSGNHMGTYSGEIVEVADGKAVTHDNDGYMVSLNLATGVTTGIPFSIPQFTQPLLGRSNLLIGKASGVTYAFDLTTGTKTSLNLQAGDTVVGVFADGKTVAIRNNGNNMAWVQKVGSARKLVATSISVSPDGTRGILPRVGHQQPIYNYGNGTTFMIDGTSAVPQGFDASGRAVVNLDNKVLRTLVDDGSTAGEIQLPAVQSGQYIFFSTDLKRAISRQGNTVAWADLTNGTGGTLFSMANTPAWSMAFSLDGKRGIAHRTLGNTTVEVVYHNGQGGSQSYTLPAGTMVRGFSPNGRLLTTQWSGGKAWLRYYDPATGGLKKSVLGGSENFSWNFGMSGDGNTVAFQTSTGYKLIDIVTSTVRNIGGQTATLVDLTGSDSAISLSKDGTLMAFGPRVFKTSNYKLVFTAPNHMGGWGMISPDNSRFVLFGDMATEGYALPVAP